MSKRHFVAYNNVFKMVYTHIDIKTEMRHLKNMHIEISTREVIIYIYNYFTVTPNCSYRHVLIIYNYLYLYNVCQN